MCSNRNTEEADFDVPLSAWCRFSYIKGRVVITGLVEASCIADDGRVQPGDILDTVNGVSLHDASKGVVLSVLRRGRGKPIVLKVVKAIGRDGHPFPPLAPYYDFLRQEVPNFCPSAYLMQRTNDVADGKQMVDGRLMYCLQYLGVRQLGQDSGVESLSKIIANLLDSHPAAVDVLFDIRETRVISTIKSTSKILFEHTYPDIASVGRYLGSPLSFAYSICIGDDLKGKNRFRCYLFQAATKECSEEIVKRIATGFSRTRWSV
uniref:PDZ domain-containing protein n=1 Tax=Eptatretus burgeri TaxID=7764 RepID=A0A8C4X1J0_EPTBU